MSILRDFPKKLGYIHVSTRDIVGFDLYYRPENSANGCETERLSPLEMCLHPEYYNIGLSLLQTHSVGSVLVLSYISILNCNSLPNLCDILMAFSNFLCCFLQTPVRESMLC